MSSVYFCFFSGSVMITDNMETQRKNFGDEKK